MKRYYHVVTERAMTLNQVIVFDSNRRNGVDYRVKKVMALKNKMGDSESDDMDKMILNDFDKWEQIADREIALEEVRKKSYPQYPSRMASLYVSTRFEDAENWADYFIVLPKEDS